MDARILQELRAIVDDRGLVSSPEELHTYECDGLVNFRVLPRAVLLPTSAEQVQSIVRICHRERIPFVARGSGTGLSGGATPVENGIVIGLVRMNRILEVDFPNARVVVEPGVLNLDVTARIQHNEFFYAPDPSSQTVCTIVAMSPKMPAARIASNTVSPRRMSLALRLFCPMARSSTSAEKLSMPRLRPRRSFRRFRRHARHRHQDYLAYREAPRVCAYIARRV